MPKQHTHYSGSCPEQLYRIWKNGHPDDISIEDRFLVTLANDALHRRDDLDDDQREYLQEYTYDQPE